MNRQQRIENVLRSELSPSALEVQNESSGHNVPAGSETHFKVVLVSEMLEGRSRVERHQKVYALLKPELDQGLHALALHLYTPTEWEKQGRALPSPHCRGGEKKTSEGGDSK